MADTKSREISVREENPGTDETGGAVKGVEVGAAEAGVADQSVMYPVDSVYISRFSSDYRQVRATFL